MFFYRVRSIRPTWLEELPRKRRKWVGRRSRQFDQMFRWRNSSRSEDLATKLRNNDARILASRVFFSRFEFLKYNIWNIDPKRKKNTSVSCFWRTSELTSTLGWLPRNRWRYRAAPSIHVSLRTAHWATRSKVAVSSVCCWTLRDNCVQTSKQRNRQGKILNSAF